MKNRWLWGLMGLACTGLLSVACTPPDDDTAESMPTEMTATLVLPEGETCEFAGTGATLSYEEKRLNYTCDEGEGLIGDIVIENGTEMSVELATLNGTTITGSTPLTFTIVTVELEDGTTCLHAGRGATLALNGKRLNYTCGGSEVGLIGDILVKPAGQFSVEKAMLEGTDLASSEVVMVRTLSAVAP